MVCKMRITHWHSEPLNQKYREMSSHPKSDQRFSTKIRCLLLSFILAVFWFLSASAQATLALDANVSRDQTSATITSPTFSTIFSNELLLAFIATDYLSGPNTTVTNVSGGGLNWVLVRRTNTQSGSSEIWRAFAPTALSNATVTATISQNVACLLTVMSFSGVDPTGTNGSGAVGATGGANSSRGAPTASLPTTRNGSWVIGVGNDYDNAVGRTVGTNQSLVHQYLTPTGDTYWVQMQKAPTPSSGATVTINDTAPLRTATI
jgi:hypothetical protein